MPASPQKIRFFYNGLRFSFNQRNRIKEFFEKVLRNEGKTVGSINYIFCRDDELRLLNYHYLKHNYYTDILTFDLSLSKKEVIAEIFISIPRVKDNAKLFGSSFSKELHRVMIHGLLHLCGYNDKTVVQIKRMRTMEEKYLLQLGFPFHVKRV